MPAQTLAPDALLLQTNLTGAVTDVDEDPDTGDASWLVAPTLQAAAAQAFYFNDTLQGTGYSMLTAAPTTANFHGSTTGSGWVPGNQAVRWGWLDYNTQVATNALATTEPSPTIITAANAGNFFRTPNPMTGDFAAGNWSVQLGIRGSAAADFNIRWHVWRSSDPTGTVTNATRVNTATIVSTTQTTTLTATLVNLAATWAAPAFSLANEYLFFTPYINVTVAGSANQTVYLVKASTSRVLTTNFTAVEPSTRARVSFPTPTYSLTAGVGLQEFRCRVRKKGAGATSPTAQLALYENGALVANLGSAQSITNTTGQVISATFDGSGRDMTQIEADVLGTGVVAGSVEVGALEWNADTTVQQVDAGFLGDGSSLFGATIEKLATDTDVRVSFPTPPETLITGAGLQEFRALVRKTSGTGTPTVRLELYNAGSFVSTVLANTDVTSTSGQVVSAPWDASLLPNPTGSETELRVYGTGVTGGATVEVGAVEWNAIGYTPQVIAGFLGDGATLFGATLAGDTTTLSAGFLGDGAELLGAQVQGPVLAAGVLGPLVPGKYPAGRYPPSGVASSHVLYGATFSSGASGGYERVKPNQILAISGLSGAVTDIDEDPDAPDSSWLQVS